MRAYNQSTQSPSTRNYFLSSVLGGLVVLVLGRDPDRHGRDRHRARPARSCARRRSRFPAERRGDARAARRRCRTVRTSTGREGHGVVFIQAEASAVELARSASPSRSRARPPAPASWSTSSGDILTNAHVVEGATQSRASRFGERRPDQGARSWARDPSTRPRACCKVDPQGPRTCTRSPLGDSSSVPGRRPGRRDRQPVRLRPHGHHRDRLRAPAPDPGPQQLHDQQRDPDRRRDQPGQLGRPAARRHGQA